MPNSVIGDRRISAHFRAHVERSIFRDSYSSDGQQALADALDIEARRYFTSIIDQACSIEDKIQRGELVGASLADRLQMIAPWLEPADRDRLVGAVKFMMR